MKRIILHALFVLVLTIGSSYGQGINVTTQIEESSRPYGSGDDPGITWKIRWDRSDLFRNRKTIPDPNDPNKTIITEYPNSTYKYDIRRWQTTPPNVQSWVWKNTENIEELDGSLFITARYNSSGYPEKRVSEACINKSPSSVQKPVRFSSGILKSSAPGFVYGYYEAAIKGSSGFPGVSPAFWLYNEIKSNPSVGKVRYQEIDIVEMTQEGTNPADRKVMDHNLHAITGAASQHFFDNGINPPVGGFAPKVISGALNVGPINSTAGRRWWRPKQNTAALRNVTNKFDPVETHIYGCRVTKQEIIWYVDGEEIGRKVNTLWQKEVDLTNPMRITLSLGIRAPYTVFCENKFVLPDETVLNSADQFFPQTMEVLYVKVFEAESGTPTNIPVSGVDLKLSEVPLTIGGHSMATPEFTPIKASNKGFTFYSVSGMENAVIDAKTGVITGLKAGTAVFRVITKDGNFSDDITVTVGLNSGQTRTATIPTPPGSATLVSGGGNPPDGENNCDTPLWVAGTTYFKNDRVSYNGKKWRVRWSKALPKCGNPETCKAYVNEGECSPGTGNPPPDNNGINCSTLPVWKKSNTFNKGDKVKLNQNAYELLKSNGKCIPGGASMCSKAQWKKIGSCLTAKKATTKRASNLDDIIKLYPSPASNQVNIVSPLNSKITIINLNGKPIISKSSKGEITLFNLQNLSKGFYIVQIETGGEIKSKKLIIK
ncbi:hypothetical protein A8C32_04670 [Flavivirga aquatica]|uniref:GH16 domain-containing protein n=1 Tax=Flavivirga aquatica TaxID=1849968 RepID=A0A1E5SHC2_9FLAO|nr:T9SS type A sorting domain-containing protein [Flavivirga aquatica]OEJ98510.1 hypothetical protein A8C32_04670 [Flavivirga aquatica]